MPTTTTSLDLLLQETGWTVECESPLEIRHDDGSFATNNAARVVLDMLQREAVEDKRVAALTTIQGAASIARHAGDKISMDLWEQLHKLATEALKD